MGYDVVVMQDCASNYGVFEVPSSDGGTYRVEYQGSERGADCPCRGFHFRKDCRHVRLVYVEACLWNPQWHDGKAEPTIRPKSYTTRLTQRGKCPACGGPTVAVRRAV